MTMLRQPVVWMCNLCGAEATTLREHPPEHWGTVLGLEHDRADEMHVCRACAQRMREKVSHG